MDNEFFLNLNALLSYEKLETFIDSVYDLKIFPSIFVLRSYPVIDSYICKLFPYKQAGGIVSPAFTNSIRDISISDSKCFCLLSSISLQLASQVGSSANRPFSSIFVIFSPIPILFAANATELQNR